MILVKKYSFVPFLFIFFALPLLLLTTLANADNNQIKIIDSLKTSTLAANVIEYDGNQTVILGDINGDIELIHVGDNLKQKLTIDYFNDVEINPSDKSFFGLGIMDSNISTPSDICVIPKSKPNSFIVVNHAQRASFRKYDYTGDLLMENSDFTGSCSVWFNGVFSLVQEIPKLSVLNLKNSKVHKVINNSPQSSIKAISSHKPPGKTFILTNNGSLYTLHQPSGVLNNLTSYQKFAENSEQFTLGKLKYDAIRNELIYFEPPHNIYRLDPETGDLIDHHVTESRVHSIDISGDHIAIADRGVVLILTYPGLERVAGKLIFDQPKETHVQWVGKNKLIVYGVFGANQKKVRNDEIALVEFSS